MSIITASEKIKAMIKEKVINIEMATDNKTSIAIFNIIVIKIGQEGDYLSAESCSVKNKGENM